MAGIFRGICSWACGRGKGGHKSEREMEITPNSGSKEARQPVNYSSSITIQTKGKEVEEKMRGCGSFVDDSCSAEAIISPSVCVPVM